MDKGPWTFTSALCSQVDTELFFPDRGDAPGARMAATICGSCIHKADCAEWGINNEMFGVWGGLNENDRRRIRRQKGIKVRREDCA